MYLGLKCTPEAHYKRVFSESENVSLIEHLLDLFLHDHAMFADFLHGKSLPGLLMAYQIHSTVSQGGRRREGGREGGREKKRD